MSGGTWVFARHGESTANAGGWLSGHRDVALTPRGEAQARALAAELVAWSFDRIYASDLQRAWRTAALATGRDATQHPALRERDLGAWEGLSRAQLKADGRMAALVTWTGAPPQGESQAQVAARVLPFLAGIDDGASTTLVVAHGGVLRILEGLLRGVPLAEIGVRHVHNAEVVAFALPAGRWATLEARLAESVGETPRSADGEW